MRHATPVAALVPLTALGMTFAGDILSQVREQPAPVLQELETVVITGVRPGPALWKVSSRDHTLWILPTLAALQRQLTWRSTQLESLMAQSRAVYTEATLLMQVSDGGMADPRVAAALMNPEGSEGLSSVLPPDLYTRFAALNEKYASGDSNLERFRPFYASLELHNRALQHLQLDSDGGVHATVRQLARKHYVTLKTLDRTLRPNARTLWNLRLTSRRADIRCARWQLMQLERDLREAIARANAWSVGDIPALRRDWEATQQRDRSSCQALFQRLAPTARAIREARDLSYATLRTALQENKSTVALVLMEEVFDPEGLIARFRKAGYQIEEPVYVK
jgi:uncharacterized protein YbaP (TraB family)